VDNRLAEARLVVVATASRLPTGLQTKKRTFNVLRNPDISMCH
jgi:hypothetical protein